MKTITLFIALAIVGITNAQKYVDMTKELSNIQGHLTIDGNQIQAELNTKEQIIITGKDLVMNDRSSFIFNNVIVQLTGSIIVKGPCKPTLMDSYIFCKESKLLKSEKIYTSKKPFTDVRLANVDFIKKLKDDPVLWIYDMSGKRVAKGKKSELANATLPTSRYDVKVVGQSFNEKVLFVEF